MSNKNLVLTICTGGKYKSMAELTHPRQKAYAEKIGADYLVIDSSDKSSPHWEKFQIYDLLTKYERIVFIDTDILIREDAPNLLEIVPKTMFGAFNEAPFTTDRRSSLIEICKEYQLQIPNWNGKYYNTGVMVISRTHRDIFKHPGKEIFSFYEQGYLNIAIHRSEAKCFDLNYKFNRMTCMDVRTGEERFASYFIHYAGVPSHDYVIELIKKDQARWIADAPDYKYQRHILVEVQGGLGDQVDAEPAIRFMRDYVYPGEDIVIKSHWPRLFQHLGLPVSYHEDFKAKDDTPYYQVCTLPGPETVTWAVVSNLLCHTVDYVAMSLLHRTLPEKDKTITLSVSPEDIGEVHKLTGDVDLKDYIVVHAGKHWVSKTFPKQWWQDLVDGLHAVGQKIILIGKDEETRGVWDLELREGIIDLRNILSLGGLIYLISQANTVISNDSAPIHIAGAFDNNIVLIPTCKHPDHILPYRTGNRNYKQISVYKKLTLDDCGQAPTEVHGASGEFIKETWDKYLPEPKQVVEATLELQRKSLGK